MTTARHLTELEVCQRLGYRFPTRIVGWSPAVPSVLSNDERALSSEGTAGAFDKELVFDEQSICRPDGNR